MMTRGKEENKDVVDEAKKSRQVTKLLAMAATHKMKKLLAMAAAHGKRSTTDTDGKSPRPARRVRQKTSLGVKTPQRGSTTGSRQKRRTKEEASQVLQKMHAETMMKTEMTPRREKKMKAEMKTPEMKAEMQMPEMKAEPVMKAEMKAADGQAQINLAESTNAELDSHDALAAHSAMATHNARDAVRHAIGCLASHATTRKECHTEDLRLRVHACALRIAAAVEDILFDPDDAGPRQYDVQVIAIAVFSTAFAMEDDAETSDRTWLRKCKSIQRSDIIQMEWKLMQQWWYRGATGFLAHRPARMDL